MAVKQLLCHDCKGLFPRESLITFKNARYCSVCYTSAVERAKFAETVCKIFDLKAPGPRIWSQRKQLREKYGYTDTMIVTALEYIKEKKKGTLQETLGLVPYYINAALSKEEKRDEIAEHIAEAIQEQKIVYIDAVPAAAPPVKKAPILWNPDDFLQEESDL